jgi:DNA-binding transcriptional ArsR family regulator
MKTADLIIHPVRLRLLRELDRETLTTQELSQRLQDVPTSSIYRHLRLLLDGGLVQVAETRLVRGIQEKSYRLSRPAVMSSDEIAAWSHADHVQAFTNYALTLIDAFSRYTLSRETAAGSVDLANERVGYREIDFWATAEELDRALQNLNAVLLPLLQNHVQNGRRKYKFATILHPIIEDINDGTN